MRPHIIDQRERFASVGVEILPESARKPVRKLNHNAYKSPAFGETKTSSLRTDCDRNAVSNASSIDFSRMHAAQRRKVLARELARQAKSF